MLLTQLIIVLFWLNQKNFFKVADILLIRIIITKKSDTMYMQLSYKDSRIFYHVYV
jgi:hypothetical protein